MNTENTQTLADKIREVYPSINEAEIIQIGETIVVMAREGIKVEEILRALQEIEDYKIISPEMFSAQKVGEDLAESLKELTINIKHLEGNYHKPLKSHNDRFVRRANNKSRW